ncbi:MAG: KH domain-containing protein [Chloroflexi bacterium]|nr:KH domain-containing protein [Chloroflexota bacterium]
MEERDRIQELVEFVAKSLVDEPDEVRVNKLSSVHSTIYELRVAPDDMGRVIGKKGRVANALRTLLRIAATREGKRAILEIV